MEFSLSAPISTNKFLQKKPLKRSNMPRKRIKHTQILCEKERKSTLNRRVNSLFKKAQELSILCGTAISIIIHDPIEGNSTMWPAEDEVSKGLTKFLNIEEHERSKKMVLQEEFYMSRLKEMTQNTMKLQKKIEEKETERLVGHLFQGKSFEEQDLDQLNRLKWFACEKLKKLQIREYELDETPGIETVIDGARSGEVEQRNRLQSFAGEKLERIHKREDELNEAPVIEAIINGKSSGVVEKLNLLQSFACEELEKLEKREDELSEVPGTEAVIDGESSGAVSSTSVVSLMKNMREDKWFIETMSGIQSNFDF